MTTIRIGDVGKHDVIRLEVGLTTTVEGTVKWVESSSAASVVRIEFDGLPDAIGVDESKEVELRDLEYEAAEARHRADTWGTDADQGE